MLPRAVFSEGDAGRPITARQPPGARTQDLLALPVRLAWPLFVSSAAEWPMSALSPKATTRLGSFVPIRDFGPAV